MFLLLFLSFFCVFVFDGFVCEGCFYAKFPAYILGGNTYYLVPYGVSVNESFRVVGLFYPNLTCQDVCFLRLSGVRPGDYFLEFSYGGEKESVVFSVVSGGLNGASVNGSRPEDGVNSSVQGDGFVSVSADKAGYVSGEDVWIKADASKGLCDLWLDGPDGSFLALGNRSGFFDYVFCPGDVGVYEAKLLCYFSGRGGVEASFCFLCERQLMGWGC